MTLDKPKSNHILLIALIISLAFLPIHAEENIETENTEPQAEEALQEQEFKPIEITGKNEAESDFKFVEVEKNDSDFKYINIKNEFYYGMKIVLESDKLDAKIKTKEIYLNAYEKVKGIAVSKSSNYKVKVYNLNNKYLGSLRTRSRGERNIRVSPFLLVPASFESNLEKISKTIKIDSIDEDKVEEKEEDIVVEKPELNEIIKEELEEAEDLITLPKPLKEFKSSVKENPQPLSADFKSQELAIEPIEEEPVQEPSKQEASTDISMDNKLRFIKVANISDSNIHIDIMEPNGSPIGSGWTISNDIYVPQFLNFQSEPVSLDSGAKLLITESKSKNVISKKAGELNIDEKGNYVWFISSPSELSPTQENN